jgi:hypothetical protein
MTTCSVHHSIHVAVLHVIFIRIVWRIGENDAGGTGHNALSYRLEHQYAQCGITTVVLVHEGYSVPLSQNTLLGWIVLLVMAICVPIGHVPVHCGIVERQEWIQVEFLYVCDIIRIRDGL